MSGRVKLKPMERDFSHIHISFWAYIFSTQQFRMDDLINAIILHPSLDSV
jgi:hypothetical protein